MQPTYTNLSAVKLNGAEFTYKTGYTIVRNWVIKNNDTGKYFSIDGVLPYEHSKAICESVASGGLMEDAKWCEPRK